MKFTKVHHRAIALLVPGYNENLHYKSYHNLIAFFKKQGIEVEFIHIVWKYRTVSDLVLQVLERCRKYAQRSIYLVGYSYGAFISFLAAPFVNPTRLYLCSTSPFFREDLGHTESSILRFLGKKRLEEIRRITFSTYTMFMPEHTLIFVGSEELPSLMHRSKMAHRRIASSRLRVVNGADHRLSDTEYIEMLEAFM